MAAEPSAKKTDSNPKAGQDRIVLTGFMGAGKTTSGRLLAGRLGWRFADVDVEIEAKTGLTIADIFRTHGEPAFREMEHQAIQELLQSNCLVIAMGGGAIEDKRTRQLLLDAPGTHLVYLEASLETVLIRCADSDSIRPVLADRENLRTRYLRRLPLYQQSHQIIAVDQLDPSQVVEAILETKPTIRLQD